MTSSAGRAGVKDEHETTLRNSTKLATGFTGDETGFAVGFCVGFTFSCLMHSFARGGPLPPALAFLRKKQTS